MSLKSTVLVPFGNASSPGTLQPNAEAAASPSPRREDTVLTTQSGLADEPRCVDASLCRSVSGSISSDESVSTWDSLRSPEFEYIDNVEVSGGKSIERKTSNGLYISDHLEVAGLFFFVNLTCLVLSLFCEHYILSMLCPQLTYLYGFYIFN